MTDFISILKFLATSNTINFIIMAAILVWIVKKINLNQTFDKSIEKIKESISKSDEEKSNSQKVLTEAEKMIDRLPEDIKTIEKNSAEKIEVFKTQIDENTQKTIFNMEQNINRIISVEEKKISNLLTEKTSTASVELAKQHLINVLAENPQLHNVFIQNSLDELEKVKLQ